MKEKNILFKLFLSTLCLSAFTFGGGYVIVTLMKKKFVDEYKWIDKQEMLDLIAIAQSAPGAIAVNSAIIIGYKLSGIWGAIVCIFATVLPPFIIISILSFFYTIFQSNVYVKLVLDGMQAGVCAIIAVVSYDMVKDILAGKSTLSIIIMILTFIAVYILDINVVFIVISCILIGVVKSFILKRRK